MVAEASLVLDLSKCPLINISMHVMSALVVVAFVAIAIDSAVVVVVGVSNL